MILIFLFCYFYYNNININDTMNIYTYNSSRVNMQTKVNSRIIEKIQFHIASTLKRLRIQGEEKQETLAGELEISRSTLSDYENGKKIPTLEHLIKIAEHYQVGCDYLIGTDSILYNDDPYATDYDTIDVSGLSHRDKLIVNALIKAMRRTMKQKDEKISLSLSELTSSNKKKNDELISTKRISDE